MQIFIPQFFYSQHNNKFITDHSLRRTRLKSSVNLQQSRVSIKRKSQSQTNPRYLISKNNNSKNQYNQGLRKPISKQQQETQQLEKLHTNKKKLEILENLEKIHSSQKLHCINFDDIVNKQSQIQLFNKQKICTRFSLIHSRKSSKKITQNLLQFQKNQRNQKCSRIAKSYSRQIKSNSFLTTNKISQPQKLFEKKAKRLIRPPTSFDDESSKKRRDIFNNGSFKTGPKLKSNKVHEYRPWSPTKNQHQTDFIFS